MFQLITTKGRTSSESLAELAYWLEINQPSFVRIVWGEIEAEVECSADRKAIVDELRRALRMEEADRLNLTVANGNIYLSDIGANPLAFIRFDAGAAVLVDGGVDCELADDETLASLLENV